MYTVAELISYLKELDPDMEVSIDCESSNKLNVSMTFLVTDGGSWTDGGIP